MYTPLIVHIKRVKTIHEAGDGAVAMLQVVVEVEAGPRRAVTKNAGGEGPK